MAPRAIKASPDIFTDAILPCPSKLLPLNQAPNKRSVPSRRLNMLRDIGENNQLREILVQDDLIKNPDQNKSPPRN